MGRANCISIRGSGRLVATAISTTSYQTPSKCRNHDVLWTACILQTFFLPSRVTTDSFTSRRSRRQTCPQNAKSNWLWDSTMTGQLWRQRWLFSSIQGQHWPLIRIPAPFYLPLESWLSAIQQHLRQILVSGLLTIWNMDYGIPWTREAFLHTSKEMIVTTSFLHSDLGLQGDALGPDSSSSIVRKIVLETGPGSQVNDFHSLPYDFVSVQPSQIRNLHFRLADYRGQTVDMLHTGLSFSLLFVPEDEF